MKIIITLTTKFDKYKNNKNIDATIYRIYIMVYLIITL